MALAPLLCAGLIGWRSLVIAGDGKKLGLYGFGAAAHIVAQVAIWQGRTVFAFTRPGDMAGQAFARSLGATGPADRRDAAGATRCGDHLCDRGRSRAAGAEGGAQGRPRGLRRHPYERNPELSLSAALGRTAARFGRQSHAAGRTRFPSSGARSASSPRPRAIRSARPTRPSPISAQAGSKAPPFSCPEQQSTSETLMVDLSKRCYC